MSVSGYRLLGYVVWHGGRWYLRRRIPSRRRVIGGALLGGAGVLAAATLARRLAA